MNALRFLGFAMLAAAPVIIAAVGCVGTDIVTTNSGGGGTVDSGTGDPADDGGSTLDSGPTSDGSPLADPALEANPDGTPYPTDNIGTKVRSGGIRGDRIANLKFLGYPNADVAQGLKPMSLAQLYDPAHKRHKLIHITAGAVWDSVGNKQTETAVPMAAEITSKEVVYVIALLEGKGPNKPVTDADAKEWIAELKVPFTCVLDPDKSFGPLFDINALPWNGNIDARTMEILTSNVGAIVQPAQINQDLDNALTLASQSTYAK